MRVIKREWNACAYLDLFCIIHTTSQVGQSYPYCCQHQGPMFPEEVSENLHKLRPEFQGQRG